eukprot:g9972.t1
MVGIYQGVYFIPALNAAICSLLSSYTLISILDHERWMKEWGDDHEAEAVMHLRTPILSAAIAMGLGGITTVHQVALSSLHLADEISVGANVMCTCLAAIAGITTMFGMLYVARLDAFAGVERVERLKEAILKRYTISELKRKKGLGKRVAYTGKMQHVVAAGTILATGIMGCWALNVLGLTGEFKLVLSTSGIVFLGAYVLVTSITSCWLLFRVLVWKPSLEYLRPLCSAFFALSLWSVDYVGKTVAIAFDHVEDGLARNAYGWSLEASRGGGEWLMLMMAFGAVLTQYAIALELRLAYCGLQDANLDLQLLAGTGDPGDQHRKSSAIHNNSKRRHTGGGRGGSARSAPTHSRRRSVVVHAAASCPGSPLSPGSSLVSPMSPGSPESRKSSALNMPNKFSPTVSGVGGVGGGGGGGGSVRGAHITMSTSVMSAVFRMGSKPSKGGMGKKCNQSAAADREPQVLVYEPSVAEDPDEETHHHSQNLLLPPKAGDSPPMSVVPLTPRDTPRCDSVVGWEVVQPTRDGRAGAVHEVGPMKKIEIPDSVV